ncbi:MAG: hypothetical protein N2259_02920 [Patescibacteria group bacterium]|nr:hypothetical protein [Patescibacteria group bacterium]
MKKFLIILSFVLVATGIALALYFTFFKPVPGPPVVETPPPTEVPTRLPVSREDWEKMTYDQRERLGLPLTEWPEEVPTVVPTPEVPSEVEEISEVAKGGPTWFYPVSEEKVQDAELARDGQSSLYYQKETGKFYEVAPDGTKKLLTDQTFPNAEKITWSPVKDKAIIEFPDGFKVMYDFQKKKQVTLPKEWYEFSFSPTGREIAFKTDSKYPEDRWLAVANPDGTGGKAIEHMGENQDKVIVSYSPNNQVIAFSATGNPRGAFEQEILLIGKYGENFPALIVDGRGFEPQWSPQGNKILYSVYSDETNYNPTLYVVGGSGDQMGRGKINLGLQTWAHKCTIDQSENFAYCAVPRNLPQGAGLVPELAANVKDDFYKIDLRTGRSTFLAEGAFGAYNVSKVFLSSDESLLYFVDQDLGRLRYIRLK